jgi:hypothetical protein
LSRSSRRRERTEVDALDERAVRRFVDAVVGEEGRLDVSFDLISVGDVRVALHAVEAMAGEAAMVNLSAGAMID